MESSLFKTRELASITLRKRLAVSPPPERSRALDAALPAEIAVEAIRLLSW